MVDFNRPPYFDDFDELKDFYRILFRPGYAVQARELTQIQTILQNQIAKFGSSIFEEGSKVVGGETVVDVEYNYIKMDTLSQTFGYIKDFIDNAAYRVVATNTTTGLVATVVNILDAENSDPVTMYVKYVTSGTSGETKTFSPSDQLVFTVYDQATGQAVLASPSPSPIQFTGQIQSGSTAVGVGSAVQITEGIRFVRGFFARVAKQTVVVSKYSNKPTAVVGLKILETIVTPEEDRSLLDNATGSENESAPGAHRFRITLELRAATRSEQDFIVLVELENGKLLQRAADIKLTDSAIGREIAGRLKDQSGDFIVNPFNIVTREHLNDGSNGGRFTALNGGDESQFVVEIENGRAYVDGYLIQQVKQDYLVLDKARTKKAQGNAAISDTYGSYFLVDTTTILGSPLPFKEIDLVGEYSLTKTVTATGGATETVTLKTGEFPTISLGSTVSTGTDDLIVEVNGVPQTASFNQTTNEITITVGSPAYAVSEELTVEIISKHAVLGTANFLTYAQETSVAGTVRMYVGNVDLQYGTISSLTGYEKDTSGTGVTINAAGVPARLGGYFEGASQFVVGTSQKFYGASKGLAIREFAFDNIASITDLSYNVNRTIVVTGNDSLVGYTWTLDANETFVSGSIQVIGLTTGADDYLTATGTLTSGGTVMEIPGSAIPTNAGTNQYLIVGKVSVNVAPAPRKYELRTRTETYTVDALVDLQDMAKPYNIELTYGFATELVSVKLSVGGTDVTSAWTFDGGQRDGFITNANITLKSGYNSTVAGQLIQVTYRYYHQTSGNEYALGGDPSVATATYQSYTEIPEYVSQFSGVTVELRDGLDFRPRIDGPSGTAVNRDVLSPDISIRADIEYYLSRIDKLFVKPSGEYFVKTGVPNVIPAAPADDSNGLLLAVMTVPAYTVSAEDIAVTLVDHKRYTFRDITEMEKRLTNLEYYTSMSLLEKSTAERKYVADDLDRFKNGFVVDDFSSQQLCNAEDSEFAASIDLVAGEARPTYKVRAAEMSVLNLNGLQQTGDLITLPYTETAIVRQEQGSKPMNVNPYDVFSWEADVTLSPASDFWVDTETRPALTVSENQFTAVKKALKASGALGTVWNSWQDVWAGRPRVVESSTYYKPNRESGGGSALGGKETTVVTATSVGQRKKGRKTTVIPQTITKSLGERVVSIGMIPFIRSRDIEFSAIKLKPNTRVWAFFDGIDVSAHCRQKTGESTYSAYGAALISDENGELQGTFLIPNDDSLRFRVGSRTFRLIDDSQNREDFATTFGEIQYVAEGTTQTKQETIQSVRQAIVRTKPLSKTRAINVREVSTNTCTNTTRWVDPLAESFLIETPGGAFATSVELFFRNKPSGAQGGTPPVTVEIREMNNGYPTQTLLPFGSATVNAEDVNVTDDGSESTKFTFPSPVYLREGGEYCLVVMANSNEYEVFVSEMGGFDTVTGAIIDKQPYAGSLFKSQNNSTWTAEQYQDLKFVLYVAQFDTTTRTLNLKVDHTELADLIDSPLEFLGVDDGDSNLAVVRVHHEAHGFREGSKVTLSGVTGSNAPSYTTLFGLTLSKFNATHDIAAGTITVDSVEYDTVKENSYLISIEIGSDTESGEGTFGGGNDVKATYDMRANVIQPVLGDMTLPGTFLDWSIQTVVRDELGYEMDDSVEVLTSDNIIFDDVERVLPSADNLALVSGTNTASMLANCVFTSENSNISPVLDTDRLGLIVVGNSINNDDTDEENVGGGEAIARYVTKTVSLNDPAISIKTIVDAAVPPEGSIEVYYRVLRAGESDITKNTWTKKVAVNTPAKSLDPDDFVEYEFTTGTLLDDNIDAFSAFQIKIVMLSSTTARVPKITAFRSIALGT